MKLRLANPTLSLKTAFSINFVETDLVTHTTTLHSKNKILVNKPDVEKPENDDLPLASNTIMAGEVT